MPDGGTDRALSALPALRERMGGRLSATFLDYDGTLTPIVAHPDDARLSDTMRARLARLADRAPLAVVSGRSRAQVQGIVDLPGLITVGSHGFEIDGPGLRYEVGHEHLPALAQAEIRLRDALRGIDGAQLERKPYTLAAHTRRVDPGRRAQVERLVMAVASGQPMLRVERGHRVLELRPDVDWDKGRAVLWLLDRLALAGGPGVLYIGDDVTDESAFAALRGRGGVTVVVAGEPRPTAAAYRLADPDEVGRFLDGLLEPAGT